MSNGPAIAVDQLAKTYRSGFLWRRRFPALQDVSFEVQQGEVFGLLGPNGAGKTTFIKILLGIIRKSSGKASLLGRPAGDRRGRLRVGYLPESLRIPRHHNALTALEFYGRLSRMSMPDIRSRRIELLERVGLASRLKTPVREYSKGMLQRLGLAQSLLHNPDVVFLDEPTDGLDPVGRNDVRILLREMKEAGKTIFVNSHLLQEVEMVCDRVAILDRGRLCGIGAPAELSQQAGQQVEVELEVQGAAEQIEAAFNGQSIVKTVPTGEQQHRITLQLADQAAVNHCIDQLRAQGVSILGFGRRRLTLEDAFLNLVKQALPSSPVPETRPSTADLPSPAPSNKADA